MRCRSAAILPSRCGSGRGCPASARSTRSWFDSRSIRRALSQGVTLELSASMTPELAGTGTGDGVGDGDGLGDGLAMGKRRRRVGVGEGDGDGLGSAKPKVWVKVKAVGSDGLARQRRLVDHALTSSRCAGLHVVTRTSSGYPQAFQVQATRLRLCAMARVGSSEIGFGPADESPVSPTTNGDLLCNRSSSPRPAELGRALRGQAGLALGSCATRRPHSGPKVGGRASRKGRGPVRAGHHDQFCAPVLRTSAMSSFMPADCQFFVMANGVPPVSNWLIVQPLNRQVNWSAAGRDPVEEGFVVEVVDHAVSPLKVAATDFQKAGE